MRARVHAVRCGEEHGHAVPVYRLGVGRGGGAGEDSPRPIQQRGVDGVRLHHVDDVANEAALATAPAAAAPAAEATSALAPTVGALASAGGEKR